MFDFSQLPDWAIVAIPVAIIFLWLFYSATGKNKSQQSSLSSEYFKGLNYLLNDEQDKALDIFCETC